MPVVGWLSSITASDPFGMSLASAFRAGLKDAGYVEGQNVAIDFRWGEGQYSRLPTLAAELVAKPVDVIMAGGPPAALAAKAATFLGLGKFCRERAPLLIFAPICDAAGNCPH
jgi:putative ABC transport system substrate-binding protein